MLKWLFSSRPPQQTKILMHRWREPSLSLHGIEGAFSEPGEKTVIPRKVIGKFSIRIVPDQTVEGVTDCVVKYLKEVWKKRGSPNNMKVGFHDLVCRKCGPAYVSCHIIFLVTISVFGKI